MTTIEATHRTPFTATLRSEWTKLVSVRATWVTLAVGILLAVGITVAIAISTGIESRGWDAVDLAVFDPVSTSLIGGILLMFAFLALGVRMAAGEYASGMMHLTLTATPRRPRVLAAKALILSAVTLVIGSIVTAAMYFGSLAIWDAYGLAAAGAPGATRAVVATALLSGFLPLLGLALAVAFRSTALAISTVLALIFVPALFGGLLPAFIQKNVITYLPNDLIDSITNSGEPALALAIVAVIAWSAGLLAAATGALTRRDA